MKTNQRNILLAALLILIAAASRIMNAEMHVWHLAPVAALGLFSGAVIKDRKYAFLVTLIAQLVSDLYIELFTPRSGFYGVNQLFVYGGMMLVTLLGTQMGKPKAHKVAGFSLAGSAIFFTVSNFGMWVQQFAEPVGSRLYTTDLKGLGQTFVMALPFYTRFGTELFINSFAGDLVLSFLLFGIYALATRSQARKAGQAAL